jgi:hypothetical protein
VPFETLNVLKVPFRALPSAGSASSRLVLHAIPMPGTRVLDV